MAEKNSSKQRSILRKLVPYFFVGPALFVLMIIVAYPMFYSLYYSFFDYNLLSRRAPKFVGFDNYTGFFSDSRFLESVANTAEYIIASVGVELILGLAIALFLANFFKGKAVKILFGLMILVAKVAMNTTNRQNDLFSAKKMLQMI